MKMIGLSLVSILLASSSLQASFDDFQNENKKLGCRFALQSQLEHLKETRQKKFKSIGITHTDFLDRLDRDSVFGQLIDQNESSNTYVTDLTRFAAFSYAFKREDLPDSVKSAIKYWQDLESLFKSCTDAMTKNDPASKEALLKVFQKVCLSNGDLSPKSKNQTFNYTDPTVQYAIVALRRYMDAGNLSRIFEREYEKENLVEQGRGYNKGLLKSAMFFDHGLGNENEKERASLAYKIFDKDNLLTRDFTSDKGLNFTISDLRDTISDIQSFLNYQIEYLFQKNESKIIEKKLQKFTLSGGNKLELLDTIKRGEKKDITSAVLVKEDNKDHYIVNVLGTHNAEDWGYNLSILKSKGDIASGFGWGESYHGGFSAVATDIYQSVQPKFKQILDNTNIEDLDKVMFSTVGHSLGGAVAELLGYNVSKFLEDYKRERYERENNNRKASSKNQVRVITLCQPAAADPSLTSEINKRLEGNYLRFFNKHDIVSKIPINWTNWFNPIGSDTTRVSDKEKGFAKKGLWYEQCGIGIEIKKDWLSILSQEWGGINILGAHDAVGNAQFVGGTLKILLDTIKEDRDNRGIFLEIQQRLEKKKELKQKKREVLFMKNNDGSYTFHKDAVIPEAKADKYLRQEYVRVRDSKNLENYKNFMSFVLSQDLHIKLSNNKGYKSTFDLVKHFSKRVFNFEQNFIPFLSQKQEFSREESRYMARAVSDGKIRAYRGFLRQNFEFFKESLQKFDDSIQDIQQKIGALQKHHNKKSKKDSFESLAVEQENKLQMILQLSQEKVRLEKQKQALDADFKKYRKNTFTSLYKGGNWPAIIDLARSFLVQGYSIPAWGYFSWGESEKLGDNPEATDKTKEGLLAAFIGQNMKSIKKHKLFMGRSDQEIIELVTLDRQDVEYENQEGSLLLSTNASIKLPQRENPDESFSEEIELLMHQWGGSDQF